MRQYLPGHVSRRRAALDVSCPQCGALVHRPCIGVRGAIRRALHQDRYAKSEGQIPA
ncbi:zinc finger domain-containing protein [Novosphingobium sp. MBES04]|uniref:zinc finger domain-containing protein n=1 Tax=Novosphingobium sp. MBES04 TaxID=1206458 RepID=UPI00404099E3